MGDFAETELDYIASVLEEDAKNYHAWSYRQWIVQSVDTPVIWSNEVQFGESTNRRMNRSELALVVEGRCCLSLVHETAPSKNRSLALKS